LIIGLFGAPLYARITIIPKNVLIPVVGCLCVLGAYTYRNLAFDTFLIMFFGVIGYFMSKANFGLAPFVLAFVLGRTNEINFRRALNLYGSDLINVMTNPIPLLLICLNILLLVYPFWDDIKAKLFKKKNADHA
jgi:putative tricarboxylic transport membrane protein